MGMRETIIKTEHIIKKAHPDVSLILDSEDGTGITLIIKLKDKGTKLEIPTKEMTPDILASLILYQLNTLEGKS